jgi:hypothetical protein
MDLGSFATGFFAGGTVIFAVLAMFMVGKGKD